VIFTQTSCWFGGSATFSRLDAERGLEFESLILFSFLEADLRDPSAAAIFNRWDRKVKVCQNTAG
jgi:hypothetical protein